MRKYCAGWRTDALPITAQYRDRLCLVSRKYQLPVQMLEFLSPSSEQIRRPPVLQMSSVGFFYLGIQQAGE
jgi:hypothetical protein